VRTTPGSSDASTGEVAASSLPSLLMVSISPILHFQPLRRIYALTPQRLPTSDTILRMLHFPAVAFDFPPNKTFRTTGHPGSREIGKKPHP
jgi:hypothetical protein